MLVQITLHWEDSENSTSHIIDDSDVQAFVKAALELHHTPGINPHNGRKAAWVKMITQTPLRKAGPFWWTTPGLKNNDDPNGVCIYSFDFPHIIWEKEYAPTESNDSHCLKGTANEKVR